MANLRDIRRRIKSVKNTSQITRAMQLVAASKMKRAQDSATAGQPYAELLARIMGPVARGIVGFSHPFLDERLVSTRGIIVVSTDKGLCGGLNANLFRELPAKTESVKYITVGRKAAQFVSRTGRSLVADFTISDSLTFTEVKAVIEYGINAYLEGAVDTVEVLFPHFVNTLRQDPRLVPLLPLTSIEDALKSLGIEGEEKDERELNFEPDIETILSQLLPLYVRREFFSIVREAKASEHSARMVAMKAATDNANNLVDSLTLDYNKARQAAITQEILEIAAATASNA
ncbi:MAG: ATP synthase F1 subunit gamma [Verrucomicrobiae bacterium]|nr:ATP synthase F1 subunit gamma [Verrucomicrobiae bacterium]